MIATLLTVVDRPNTVPTGLLAIITSLVVTRLALVFQWHSKVDIADILFFLGLFSALLAIFVILCMPFRSPMLPNDRISKPLTVSTHELRSPEDNLTLWQFMSVSWMSPLISAGSARQLNDEDVWSLSFQFQHKALHESFRLLKGSVVKRLLVANGIDLLIVGSLGILESLTSVPSRGFDTMSKSLT